MAIAFRAVGTWAEYTTDLQTVAIPAGAAAGDRMFLWVQWKDFAITLATPAGWTLVSGLPFSDGNIASGNGTGSITQAVFFRDWQSGDANPTLDFGSTTNLLAEAVVMVLSKGASESWGTPTFRGSAGTFSTSNTVVNTQTTVDVPDAALVMCGIGIRDDSATFTRPTDGIAAVSGVTWNGNYVESPATHYSTVTGNDHAGDLGYRIVTTGGTGLTLTATVTAISATETGSVVWVIQGVASSAIDMTGSASGTGAASGAAAGQFAVAGTATGAGSASGTAGITIGLAGSATGTGSAAGTTGLQVSIAGAATGTGAAAGAAARIAALTASAQGTGATTQPTPAMTWGLAGSATGTGQAQAGVGYLHGLGGSATGAGSASGAATRRAALDGSAAGLGTTSGAAGIRLSIAGSALGTGSATGSFVGTQQLTGSAAGAGQATGAAQLVAAMAGAGAGVGNATAVATRFAGLAANAPGLGEAAGGLTLKLGLDAAAMGAGFVAGSLDVQFARAPLSYRLRTVIAARAAARVRSASAQAAVRRA